MKRREFIKTTGQVIATSMFFSGDLRLAGSDQGTVSDRRPDPSAFDQPIMKAISWGMNAPNPHNSQAWKFKLLNDMEALFFVDETRLLHDTDPPSRQIHIGCGCFLETLRLGASTLGYTTELDLFPEGIYPLEYTGTKPVALIRIVSEATEPLSLSSEILTRQTHRAEYEGPMISDTEFKELIETATPEFSTTHLENDPNRLSDLIELLYRGMDIEAHSHGPYDESRLWFRVGQKDIETKRDGINFRTNGSKGLGLFFLEMIVDTENETAWHKETPINSFLKGYKAQLNTAKGVVYWKTETNTQLDWVNCGIDYVRFQLAAEKAGLVLHPLNQVIQEYPEMDDLRSQFNQFVEVQEPAKVQMIVRIGRGDRLYYSYRRDPQDLLT